MMTMDESKKPLRERSRLPLMLLGVAVVLAGVAYAWITGGRYETTEDAYVQAARVAISADVGGRVQAVLVRDNQRVRKGDVLFQLDDAPLRIAVSESAAQLAAARVRVETLKANYRQRLAELAAAQETLRFRQTEHERQTRLVAAGVSSRAEVDQSAHLLDEARTRVESGRQQVSAAVASLAGSPGIVPERHPDLMQAQALLDRAQLNLSHAVVRAPSDGVVTRVPELQPGSYVVAAKPVFALVSANDAWVEANFKEDQVAHMRVGQEATVRIDAYPDRTFTGRVAGLSPGTGSIFSVLPAENATGNWVKVVQRLPVRIELARHDERDVPVALHAGLSAEVRVDTGRSRSMPGAGTDQRGAQGSARDAVQ